MSLFSGLPRGSDFRNRSIVEVQSSTLEDPDALPPTMQIQMAERLGWIERLHEMPGFDRFPE